MTRDCVVGGCLNMPKDGVSFHNFPNDETVRKKWIKAVDSTRKHWKGPTKHTKVCSDHFSDDCFDQAFWIKKSMGIYTRKKLVKGSVPLIFVRSQPIMSEDVYRKDYQTSGRESRQARERKKEKQLILKEIMDQTETNLTLAPRTVSSSESVETLTAEEFLELNKHTDAVKLEPDMKESVTKILKEITDPTETNLTLAPRTVSSSESVETPTAEEFLEFNKHTDAVKLEPDLKDSVTKILKEITDPTETNLTLAPRTVSSSESVETPTAEEFLEFNKHTDAVKLEPDLKDSVTKILKEITDQTETNLTLAPRTVSSSESVETPTAEEFPEFNKRTDAVKLEPDLNESVTKILKEITDQTENNLILAPRTVSSSESVETLTAEEFPEFNKHTDAVKLEPDLNEIGTKSAVVEKTTYNIACQASRNPKIRSKRTQANLKSEGELKTYSSKGIQCDLLPVLETEQCDSVSSVPMGVSTPTQTENSGRPYFPNTSVCSSHFNNASDIGSSDYGESFVCGGITKYEQSQNYPEDLPYSGQSFQQSMYVNQESLPFCSRLLSYDMSDHGEPETLLMECESVSDDYKYDTEGHDLTESLTLRTRQEQSEKKQSEALVNSLYGLPVNLPFCIRHSSQTLDKVLDSKVYIIVEQVNITDMKLKQIKPIRINVNRGMQDVTLPVSNRKRSQYKDSLVKNGVISEKKGVKKTCNDKIDETEDLVENGVEINESINSDSEQDAGEMKDDRDVNIEIVSGILNDVINSIGKQLQTRPEYSGEQSNNIMGKRTSLKRKCESKLYKSSNKKLLKFENGLDANLPRSARIRSKGYRINYAKLDELQYLSDDKPTASDDDSDTTLDLGNNPSSEPNDEAGPSGITDKSVRKEDPDFISNEYVRRSSSSDSSYTESEMNDSEEDEAMVKKKEIAAKRQLQKLSLQSKRIKVNLNDHSDKFYTEDQISVERKDRGKTDLEKTFKLLVCAECHKFRTDNKSQMEIHLEYHINGDLSCKQCEFQAHSLHDLLKHKGCYHSSKKKYFCLICDAKFSSKLMYRDHISTVHHLLPFLCSICSTKESPVAFKDSHSVREHYLEIHRDQMFQCYLCGLCYLSKSGLSNHICAAKNTEEKIPCEICGKKINTLGLDSHKMKVHFNVRPYPCSQCQYAARKPRQLKEHIQAKHEHNHSRKCDECDFTCVRAFQLVSHKRTHTGDKPYKCDQCPYAAAWNVQLKDHKKLHGGPMGRECEACGIVIRKGPAYTKHMKKEHGEIAEVKSSEKSS